MGEGGKKLDQQGSDGGVVNSEVGKKQSGTRLMVRSPDSGKYSLGRGVVPTDRPGLFEDDEDDITRVDVPKLAPLRSDITSLADGIHPDAESPSDISDAVVQRISSNMASEHPSSARGADLPTIVDPTNVRVKCRQAGVEDDVPGNGEVSIDSAHLATIIDIRRKEQDKVRGIILRHGLDYAWPWWESADPLVKVWCQINSGVVALPDWQFKRELENIIDDKHELGTCMREHDGHIVFDKPFIERALLKRFSKAEIDARFSKEKDLITAKKVTKR